MLTMGLVQSCMLLLLFKTAHLQLNYQDKSVIASYHRSPSDEHDKVQPPNARSSRASNSNECWPKAVFGLFESASGCPSGMWSTGEVRHVLRPGSAISHPNYLNAQLEKESLALHFCIRDPDESDEPEEFDCADQNPPFPAGSYCVFNGHPKPNIYERCPAGFFWSAVGVNDVGETTRIRKRGLVPTGEYFSTFTHYYFCCRNDSSPSTTIVLPTSRSFVLFPLSSKQECQAIQGLRSKMFSIFFDTESGSYANFPNRLNAPYATTDVVLEGVGSCNRERRGKGIGLQLFLCYYSRW